MFENLKRWYRKAVSNLIGKSHIEQKLNISIPLSEKMEKAIRQWVQMYENAAEWLNEDVVSLNLPATIASELARGVTIEMESKCTGSPRANYLDTVYQQVVTDAQVFVEYGIAMGDLILRPYVKNGQLGVDYIRGGNHWPLAFDSNGYSTAEVFFDREVIGDRYYTLLNYQRLEGTDHHISNHLFVSASLGELGEAASLGEVERWKGLEPYAVIRNVKHPLWGQFKMPLANQIEPGSPMGVSGYSRAVDLIREADLQYSRLLWEFESGERALHVDENAFHTDPETGERILPHKRLYRALDIEKKGGEQLFDEWTPTLREQNILNGLNKTLSLIEDKCGLSRGSLCDDQQVDPRTAYETKILRQREYATITDTQKALRTALERLVYAMDVWATVASLAPAGAYELSFQFDDSIVVDRQSEFLERMQMTTAGILQPWEMRQWYLGETEDDAKANVPAPVRETF